MKKYYGSIDGLRTTACIGIVMMHAASNSNYSLNGFLYESVIPSFTNFVFLFMAVSAFSMCCGYYEKVLNNEISFSDFYGKRFKKILPFFGILVLLDVIVSPSVGSVYEAFADLTLLFGFLPDTGNISVIGVGWFLGLIFVFYLCFPFFCVLIENRRRAWLAFAVSLFYNYVCTVYFDAGRTNILYCSCFFLGGGLIYLYRGEIAKFSRIIAALAAAAAVAVYYAAGENTITCLLVSLSLLIYAVRAEGGILENRITKFFGSISMEIYLSHMVTFRIIEKTGLNTAAGNGWIQYAITVVGMLAGASLFSVVMQKAIALFFRKIRSNM